MPQLAQPYAMPAVPALSCANPAERAYTSARNVLISTMAIASIGRGPARLRPLQQASLVAENRQWFPTRQAAQLLGTSEATLRRRLSRPAWCEGRHYRWVTRNKRITLEVNVPMAIRLMNRVGWS
jgi:hypothetical protein